MAREPICSQPCCKVAAQLIGHQGTTTLFRGLPAFFLPHCFWEASTPPPPKSLFSSDRPFHTQTLASHKAASSVPPLHRTPKTTHGDSRSGGHNSHSNTSTATSPLMQSIWLVVGFFWWIIGFGCVWVFFLLGGGGLFSCLFLSFPYC